MNKQSVIPLIGIVHQNHIKDSLPSKQIKVSNYSNVSNQIPDVVLIIDEVFPEDELDSINERFEQYLAEHCVFPFLGILGGNVIGVGYGPKNHGKIFYFDFDFDFDFGLFELDANIEEFLAQLESGE